MSTARRWLPYYRSKPRARLRLFCFPFAGGGASVFNNWASELPEQIDLCAVQLPGREDRLSDPPFTRIEALVEATAEGLRPWVDRPFALFGHSLGGRLAFELARLWRDGGGPAAQHLIVSACRAPHIPRDDDAIHHLEENAFVEKLRERHSVPEQVLEERELRDIFLPLLRADLAVFETYRYRDGEPLDCPITAFGGIRDPRVGRDHLAEWERHTRASCQVQMFQGDHFFLRPQRNLILHHLTEILSPIAERSI